MHKLIALCKRRGFVFAGSDLYGGLNGTYDYGPLGVQLKKNLTDVWWRYFVTSRRDCVGLDSGILLARKVWEKSGHVDGFVDSLADCPACKRRSRADHLVEQLSPSSPSQTFEQVGSARIATRLTWGLRACSICSFPLGWARCNPRRLFFAQKRPKACTSTWPMCFPRGVVRCFRGGRRRDNSHVVARVQTTGYRLASVRRAACSATK